MVVDDDRGSLRVLSEILKAAGYDVIAFDSGINALKAIFKSPPDLIILDIVMPGIDGLELCRMLKENPEFSDIPVLFISGVDDVDNKLRAFSVGGADYITKPFHLREVQARVKTHLQLRAAHLELKQYNRELERMVEEKVREILQSQLSTIVAISKLVEYRDIETGQHIERVQMFCKVLALSLKDFSSRGLSVDDEFADTIYWAAALHDIGKVGIPDNILLKPNCLTPSEREIMKSHTIIGARALEEVRQKYPRNKFLNMGIEIARWHHERWDGKGYPDGLSGEEIPLSARIMALADMYDALRSKRPYKPAFGHVETVETIKAEKGKALDPTIVEAFLKVEESFSQIWENLTYSFTK